MLSTPIRRKVSKELVTNMNSNKSPDEDGKQGDLLDQSLIKRDKLLAHGGPFATSNWTLKFMYKLSCRGIFVWYLAFDYLLSRFISTTANQQHPENFVYFVSKVLATLCLVLFLTPFAVVSFLVWFPLQLIRPRPYSCLSPRIKSGDSKHDYQQVLVSRNLDLSFHPVVQTNVAEKSVTKKYQYIFFLASGNVCLMPEVGGRFNNLFDTVNRAKNIASYFCNKNISLSVSKSPKRLPNVENENIYNPSISEPGPDSDVATRNTDEILSVGSSHASIVSKENVVSDIFPESVDFICLQEVFDSRATKCILRGLKEKFPYIIYDVSWPLHSLRLTLLTSGLCIASRFPFIDAVFHAFPHGSRDDKLACKGLLMTKIFFGKNEQGSNLVGYVSNTHLQAWSRPAASEARCRQLDLIDKWMTEFTEQAERYDDCAEIVLFNVIAGDFNFDKSSYFDHNEQTCSFMQNTCDPCVDDTGRLHSWVVGTELHPKNLHDNDVCTPKGLQRMLVSELERHRYVASTIRRKSSLQRKGDGKRKIDHILYKNCDEVTMVRFGNATVSVVQEITIAVLDLEEMSVC